VEPAFHWIVTTGLVDVLMWRRRSTSSRGIPHIRSQLAQLRTEQPVSQSVCLSICPSVCLFHLVVCRRTWSLTAPRSM